MTTGIIGKPIKHSLSPVLHEFWMKEHKIESAYNIYEIDKKNIAFFLKTLKEKNINGLNVTIPYKSEVIKLLDHVEKNAILFLSTSYILYVDSILCSFIQNSCRIGDKLCLIGFPIIPVVIYFSFFSLKTLKYSNAAAAVSSIDFLVTSIMGHLFFKNNFFANSTSSFIKSSSI